MTRGQKTCKLVKETHTFICFLLMYRW